MSASILIAYATRGGSTAEVAQSIAATMQEAGLAASAMAMAEVKSLEGYSAVILGAPLYCGKLPREFHRFVEEHAERLGSMRPWLFVLGPTRPDAKDFELARKQAEQQIRRYGWLKIAELHIFGGRWDMQHLTFPFSLARHLPASVQAKIPPADIRDWAAIRGWALEIARMMKPAA